MQVASDWPNGIISTTPFSLTRSRGEDFRVVGIILMVEQIGSYTVKSNHCKYTVTSTGNKVSSRSYC